MTLLNAVFNRRDTTWPDPNPSGVGLPKTQYADAEDVRNHIRRDLARFGDVGEIHGQILSVRSRWKLFEVTTTVNGKTVTCEMRDNELHYRSDLGPIILPPASYSFQEERANRTLAQIHEDTFTDQFGTPEAQRRIRTYRIARAINSMKEDDLYDPLTTLTMLVIMGSVLYVFFFLMTMSGLSTAAAAAITVTPMALLLAVILLFCVTSHVAERTKRTISNYDLTDQPQEDLNRTLTELCEDHNLEFMGSARPTMNNIVNLQNGDPATITDHHLTFLARPPHGSKVWFITDGLSVARA